MKSRIRCTSVNKMVHLNVVSNWPGRQVPTGTVRKANAHLTVGRSAAESRAVAGRGVGARGWLRHARVAMLTPTAAENEYHLEVEMPQDESVAEPRTGELPGWRRCIT